MAMTNAIIDCRDQAAFVLGHIKGACNLPANNLFLRMHELPDKSQAISLCGDLANIEIARQFLNEKNYTVSNAIIWNDELIAQLKIKNEFQTGNTRVRLWQASPLLREFLQTQNDTSSKKTSLDIACGSGRDSVYLALHGYDATGIDYSADALSRAKSLAFHNQVNINAHEIDIENDNDALMHFLNNKQYDLICVFRYLHRPLLSLLPSLLKPSGFLIYQTFQEGCELMGSPRNPRFLLKKDELATHFQDLTILKNETIFLNDNRPTSAFIGQKNEHAHSEHPQNSIN